MLVKKKCCSGRVIILQQPQWWATRGFRVEAGRLPPVTCHSLPDGTPWRDLRWENTGFQPQMSEKKMLVTQSCPTLCNPMDCSLPGSSVHGILPLRKLKWVVIPFSRGSSQLRDQTWVSCIAGKFFTIWATREDQWLRYVSKEWFQWAKSIKFLNLRHLDFFNKPLTFQWPAKTPIDPGFSLTSWVLSLGAVWGSASWA